VPGIQGQAHFTQLLTQQNVAWMDDAACAARPDLDYFDDECGLQEAVTVCHSCPVMDRCLDYAIVTRPTDGVWGGLWGDQLQAMIRRRVPSRR